MEKGYEQFYKAQNLMEEILRKDLIGPVKEDEELEELPSSCYIMGKVYPISDSNEYDCLKECDSDLCELGLEEKTSLNQRYGTLPTSMGITFVVKQITQKLHLHVSYARYIKIPSKNVRKEVSSKEKYAWKRVPVKYTDDIDVVSLNWKSSKEILLSENVFVYIYCNYVLKTGEKVITVTLVNRQKSAKTIIDNQEMILFQARIFIESTNQGFPFSNIDLRRDVGQDDELVTMELLYYEKTAYAQGHNCSVTWRQDDERQWVATEYLPVYTMCQMMPGMEQECAKAFSMKRLAQGEVQVLDELDKFNDRYFEWINAQEKKLLERPYKYHVVGRKNLDKCRKVNTLIKCTIAELRKSYQINGAAWKAFCYANEAMLMQRTQTMIIKGERPDVDNIYWYPFQLAFILCEIYSFVEPDSDERKKVDLLWFPTGGGKTEAYLGIAAFVIFLRRLNNQQADGVTVIMRYTLRLLTMQQFERASTLIIACEILRQRYNLGETEISIGLWVGDQTIPNSIKDAKKNFDDNSTNGNPRQIRNCPWCGHKILEKSYEFDDTAVKMKIRCPNEKCPTHNFTSGLPIYLIDESIYRYLPTFLVATVDKFAQLPKNDKVYRLFGNNDMEKMPPELIIQDELHLLTGPLGTIVGLYEAAITEFCSNKDIPVKIISSTATVRNAGQQIKSLYGREFNQFPPQGISADDSFFAVISHKEQKPARTYYGVMAQGTSNATAHARVNSAILFATRYLVGHGFSDYVVDNYWTLLNYFNSKRELGGTLLRAQDEFQNLFQYLSKTKFAYLYPLEKRIADMKHDAVVEISANLQSTDIPRMLEKLERTWNPQIPEDAISFALATNMISVGMDISRLGTMIMMGQPKTNAEYIQATSRVGRKYPGSVITVYNGSRTRDKSHYEQFINYHQQCYRYVEASSLTPFSERAMDRGLQALLVAYVRFYLPSMRSDSSAWKVINDGNADKVRIIIKKLLSYVKIVDNLELEGVKARLEDLLEIWLQRAVNHDLCYLHGKNNLIAKDTDIANDFRMMNSMRNVEEYCKVFIRGE